MAEPVAVISRQSGLVNTKTVNSKMGRGHTDDVKAMKEFFNLLRK